jgi:anti-sigma factor RsiW
MTNEVRPVSDSLIALIQPFLDDELAPDERARVEAQLAADPVLREMVDEQVNVRQVLRDMPQEPAPQALQARVLLELDAVDREFAAAAPPPKVAREPAWRRLRTFLRGAAIMVPAGATALALFLVTRTGTERHVAEASPTTSSAPASAGALLGGDGPLILGSAPAARPGVRLVGAELPADQRAQGPVVVERQVGPRRVLDRHEPAGGPAPSQGRDYRGRHYWLGQVAGRPAVAFESDGVRHTLTRDDVGFSDDREYMFLLALGHALQDAER